MTANEDGKLDNMTVRRFAKLLKNSGSSNTSTPITTGTVVQNDNSIYVAVDNDTLVPIADTNSNVKVGDKVTLALDDDQALIVGNITDQSPTVSELTWTNKSLAKAHEEADDASKVATNYIDIDENKGITVGNMQEDTLGKNTYIDANGVSIRDGETVLASFEDDEISLGEKSDSATIYLCKRNGEISYVDGDIEYISYLQIKTPDQTTTGTKEDWSPTDHKLIAMNILTGEITGSDGLPVAESEGIFILPAFGTEISVSQNTGFYVGDGSGPFGGNKYLGVAPSKAYIITYGTDSSYTTNFQNTFTNSPNVTKFEIKNTEYDEEKGDWVTTTKILRFSMDGITVDDIPVSLEGHDHANDVLSPSYVNANILLEGGYSLSHEGHTHAMSEVYGTLPISKGGTGSTTASGALTALGGAKASHTHTLSNITDLSSLVYKAGDSWTTKFLGAGFVTTAGTEVFFTITPNKVLYGVTGATFTSAPQVQIRCDAKYCYGSSASVYVAPASTSIELIGGNLIIKLKFSNTTNIVNNSPVGIWAKNFTIKFS